MISNLIDNAIKYTPEGSVSVRVERDDTKNMGVVKIIDTGAGIPREALPKLFDKFVRARNAQDINVTGTGLGLYIIQRILEQHSGSIHTSSEYGVGTTFRMKIPIYQETEKPQDFQKNLEKRKN